MIALNKDTVYSLELHILKLKRMLRIKHTPVKMMCPAKPNFMLGEDKPDDHWKTSIEHKAPCTICKDFIGVEGQGCPCMMLGEEEAIKRTREKLKEAERA